MPNLVEQVIRPEILRLSPYHVPSSSGMIKLDAMENPYSLPEALQEEIAQLVTTISANRYPDSNSVSLKSSLRETMEIPMGMDIMLGNGSDEIIQIIASALARPGAVLMSVEPAFVMFRMIATYTNMEYIGVPLKADFSLDLDLMLDAIAKHQPAVIFIAYPNNPTGNSFDYGAIIEIIKSTSGMVVLDEAYYAYSDKSFLSEISNFPNLLVLRTISKIGFAGLRLGLLIGDQETIAQLNKLRLPYNINVLTQTSANFLLKDRQRILNNAQIIIKERSRLTHELSLFPKFKVYPSQTNFILVHSEDAHSLHSALKKNGILVKGFSKSSDLANFIRISVSEPSENNSLIDAIRNYYGS